MALTRADKAEVAAMIARGVIAAAPFNACRRLRSLFILSRTKYGPRHVSTEAYRTAVGRPLLSSHHHYKT